MSLSEKFNIASVPTILFFKVLYTLYLLALICYFQDTGLMCA